MASKPQDPFFRSIGSLAEETDRLPDEDEERPESGNKPPGETGVVDEERPIHEIESLCMNCEKQVSTLVVELPLKALYDAKHFVLQGMTRMMLTSIPYFREVIVSSFRCEHCGEQNNEIQTAGQIADQGTLYTAKILNRADTNRQVVRSATATIFIPELELTIPPKGGQLTTVEGLLRDIINDLSVAQPLRRIQDPPTYGKIDALLTRIHNCLGDNENGGPVTVTEDGEPIKGDEPVKMVLTVKVDDPAGNSWVEFLGSMADPKWSLKTYERSRKQNVELGLANPDEETREEVLAKQVSKIDAPLTAGTVQKLTTEQANGEEEEERERLQNEEIFVFPGICSSCGGPLDTMMKKVVIPYFKDILIMSTNCDRCGYRDNEIKSGAAISEQGKKITLKVEDAEDLARDILKSESCGLEIPEIQLVLSPGTLGGRFTTLEGLLTQVYDELSEKAFARNDTVDVKEDRQAFEQFLGKLKAVMTASIPFTVILDDPLANSYLQNIYAPDPDPNMTTELYERTFEQNEELGLNDMIVEGYEGDPNQPPTSTTAESGKTTP
ncbi:nucleolar zinc-finger protein [Tulasnella sp. 403]|nr:nucleolar zinc-finger protein [Tulasnella sp. 403]